MPRITLMAKHDPSRKMAIVAQNFTEGQKRLSFSKMALYGPKLHEMSKSANLISIVYDFSDLFFTFGLCS